MTLKSAIVLAVLGISGCVFAQMPPAPAASPGNGLTRHDFVYSGESPHARNIFIVRGGKIVWSYNDPTVNDEITDTVMLSNGNVLFTRQSGVTEITPEKKVIWNYDAPTGTEVHTAVPIGKDHVLYVQNGDPALVRVVNIVTGMTEKEFPIKTMQPPRIHGQFRHARLTAQGTLLVAHQDMNKVVEYDSNANELWSFPADHPWGVTPLKNGNVLITESLGSVREVTRRGDVVWSWSPADAPGYKFSRLQQAWRLPNGNTVIDNSVGKSPVGTLQAIEVTPAKQVVWVLASWTDPANLGPATTIQFFDDPTPIEDVHFGDFK